MYTPRTPRPRPLLRNRSVKVEATSSAQEGTAPQEATEAGRKDDGAPLESSLPPPVRVAKLSATHPLAHQALATLRNVRTERPGFRSASARLLNILLLEATMDQALVSASVIGSQGALQVKRLQRLPVFLALAPEGLGIAREVISMLPEASVGSLNVRSRNADGEREVRLHLPNAPALRDASVVLFAPVVGLSIPLGAALNFLRIHGVGSLSLVSFVGFQGAVDMLQQSFPDVRLFLGAVDPDADDKGNPLPGVGDFSARYYS